MSCSTQQLVTDATAGPRGDDPGTGSRFSSYVLDAARTLFPAAGMGIGIGDEVTTSRGRVICRDGTADREATSGLLAARPRRRRRGVRTSGPRGAPDAGRCAPGGTRFMINLSFLEKSSIRCQT
ncbi:hypothetical protein GCM10009530_19490 [Microbispora corallina]|uniref:Uncharacterized protein n=1 Tax=Microbispora corallina TaxID=83302 RepID=A0ABQ4FU99_9ACTN|nr:hypothetical protein Mco01_13920 [Microbispora corallina]